MAGAPCTELDLIVHQGNASVWGPWFLLCLFWSCHVFSFIRFRTCFDVQWWICAGKPSPCCGFQAAARGTLWHLPESHQEAASDAQEDGDWHGETPASPPCMPHICHAFLEAGFTKKLSFLLFSQGVSNWYVQTYEPAGRPENHGGNEESRKFRSSPPGQLHRSHSGI